MADNEDIRSILPDRLKNHCMIGKYKYETVDEESGKHLIFTQ